MDEIYRIRGNTFDIKIDLENGKVSIGTEIFIDGMEATRAFHKGYFMGREHKKKEIRLALGV